MAALLDARRPKWILAGVISESNDPLNIPEQAMCHPRADLFFCPLTDALLTIAIFVRSLVAALPISALIKYISRWLMSGKTHHDASFLSHSLSQVSRVKDTSFMLVCVALVISALPNQILARSTLCLLQGTPCV